MSDAIQELPNAPSAAPPSPPKLVRASVLSVLARRSQRVLSAQPKAVAICVCISAVLAVGVAIPFTRYRWEPSAVILHTPLPIPENQKSLYAPPSLQTQMSLVKSPLLLGQLTKEFDIDAPPEMFDKVFKVEMQKNTDTISVTLKWKDGDQGAALVNRLAELFIQQSADTRQRRLAANLADLEIDLRHCKERLAAANDHLRKFQVNEKALDVKGGVERLNADIVAIESSLATVRRSRLNYLAQRTKLDKHIADLRTKESDGTASEFTTSDETVADNRRRQDRLRELIEDERRSLELQPLLETKRKELQRLRDLRTHLAATQSQIEQLEAEIGGIVAKLTDNDKIKQWKQELERIDKVVVPKGAKKGGSPIIQQTLAKRLELDLQVTAVDEELGQLERDLTEKQRSIGLVTDVQRRADVLVKDIEQLDTERLRLEGMIATVHLLQGNNTREFMLVTPAHKGDYPTGSNRKVLFGATFVVSLLLCLSAVLGRDLRTRPPSADELALSLGLVPLGRLRREQATDDQGLRRIALRIRQQVGDAGSIILCTATKEGGNLDGFLGDLSRYFAGRDERVLILDARLSRGSSTVFAQGLPEPVQTGLSDYLTFRCLEQSEVVHPTHEPGVDYLPAGIPTHADRVATHRMRELLDELRSIYTLILLIGPVLTEMVDLEILAAHARGIAVYLDNSGCDMARVRATLHSLTELKAPLLGAVVADLQ